jgi:4-hydroxybenzoate polyprenyltransferase
MYAMVDKNDDIKIGVKSTAILFGSSDKSIIAGMQIIFVILLMQVGVIFNLHSFYYFSLVLVSLLFIYQQWLIRERDRESCFKAFLNNNWVGLIIFAGVFLQ